MTKPFGQLGGSRRFIERNGRVLIAGRGIWACRLVDYIAVWLKAPHKRAKVFMYGGKRLTIVVGVDTRPKDKLMIREGE